MPKKNYVFDTNVLIHDPASLYRFQDNDIYIPIYVLEEIDGLKNDPGERGRSAREATRALDELRSGGYLSKGVEIQNENSDKNNGRLFVYVPKEKRELSVATENKIDHCILQSAIDIAKTSEYSTILVTMDINLRVRAEAMNIQVAPYEFQSVDVAELGNEVVPFDLTPNEFNEYYKQGFVKLEYDFDVNTCLLLTCSGNIKKTALGRVRFVQGEKVVCKLNIPEHVMGIKPRNMEQQFALDMLLDDSVQLVTLMGFAGCGKTLITLCAGLYQILEEPMYTRMLVSRPVMPLGKDVGFLPGDINEKLNPYMKPIYDNLDYLLMSSSAKKKYDKTYENLFSEGLVEVEPLTYIRGRSIPNQFILVDECLTKNHLISMSDGSVRDISDIKVSDNVCSVNNLKLKTGIVDGLVNRKTDKILTLKFHTNIIKCTENHPFYVFNDDFTFSKKKAIDLTESDFIACPRKLPSKEINFINSDLAYFVAYILCDGHVEKDYRTLKVDFKKDLDHTKRIFELGISQIDDISKVRFNKNNRGDYTLAYHSSNNTKMLCEKYSIPNGNKSLNIRVPKDIFTANTEAKKAFIQACFDAEGDVNIREKSLIISFNSVSLLFCKEINILLRHFGIVGKINEIIDEKFSGGKLYRIILAGHEARLFAKEIGFALKRKQKMANKRTFTNHENKLLNENENNFINSFYFDSVKSISIENGSFDVYDFRVPESGNFIVDGMMSSNCQNLTPHEAKTIMTRCGENTKIVFTGDVNQIDNPYVSASSNGLSVTAKKMRNKITGHLALQKGERSELATLAAEEM